MYNKQIGVIKEITHNGFYSGNPKPKHHSKHLSALATIWLVPILEAQDEEDNGLASFNINLEEMDKEDVKRTFQAGFCRSNNCSDRYGRRNQTFKVGDLSESSFSLLMP